ncbi:MAG: hypothetical protein ACI89J_001908 [Hyphomicrobiaceae bacterium]|jgi:hypothetical protein
MFLTSDVRRVGSWSVASDGDMRRLGAARISPKGQRHEHYQKPKLCDLWAV